MKKERNINRKRRNTDKKKAGERRGMASKANEGEGMISDE